MKKFGYALSMAMAVAIVALAPGAQQAVFADTQADVIKQGKELVVNRRKGNCVSCHIIEDEPLPGTHGPPLIFMKLRFPDKSKLRARIFDATAANPNTMMPPFGSHGILSSEEIDKITEYIYTL